MINVLAQVMMDHGLAVAGAFVGHGAYGAVLGKPAWFGYLAVLGVSQAVVASNDGTIAPYGNPVRCLYAVGFGTTAMSGYPAPTFWRSQVQ